jgi:hypothetical protein
LKIKFDSPFQDKVDIIDLGRVVSRGETIEVSDEDGKALLENPHFTDPNAPKPEPKPAPAPKAAEPAPAAPKPEPPAPLPEPEKPKPPPPADKPAEAAPNT